VLQNSDPGTDLERVSSGYPFVFNRG
jgi:hypothetical protein